MTPAGGEGGLDTRRHLGQAQLGTLSWAHHLDNDADGLVGRLPAAASL
jgi:hypothetical protein